MSCQQDQLAVAKKAANAAGISQNSSRAAGTFAGGRKPGPRLTTSRPPRPRTVRQASKMYGKLPLKKKEKLWAVMSQAALSGPKKERQAHLNRAVRDFGPGIVAAAMADDINRAKKENDDWTVERYRELEQMLPAAARETKTQAKVKKESPGPDRQQARFFEQYPGDDRKPERQTSRNVINLSDGFEADDLRQLSIQLAFGAAAARRQLKLLTRDAPPGISHSDPRVWDWVEKDHHNFQFLHEQVTQARHRKNGLIDISTLNDNDRVELWEFSKFEADRALRNIDHLQSGWSHLKGPTAAYLTDNHKLEARFFSYIAAHLEPALTPAMLDEAGVINI